MKSTVAVIDPCRDDRWLQLVNASKGSLFVSPPWLRAVEATYEFGLEATVLLDDSDRASAGLVYCQLDDALGRRVVSTPFCDFCDPIVDSAEDWQRLSSSLRAGEEQPIQLRVLDCAEAVADQHFRGQNDGVWHGIGLDQDSIELWQRLGSTARRNIKKAQSADVKVRFDDTTAGVDAFYRLHQSTRRSKYGLLTQPRSFFHNIHHEFNGLDAVTVATAEHEGQPIAAIFLIEWNGRAYYKFNASDPAALNLRPNDLLMWESMLRSAERGNDLLDLGMSDANQEGLVRYKQKFASAEGALSTLRAGPERTEQREELGPVLGQLTNLLTDDRVPMDLSERAGEILYRYFV